MLAETFNVDSNDCDVEHVNSAFNGNKDEYAVDFATFVYNNYKSITKKDYGLWIGGKKNFSYLEVRFILMGIDRELEYDDFHRFNVSVIGNEWGLLW